MRGWVVGQQQPEPRPGRRSLVPARCPGCLQGWCFLLPVGLLRSPNRTLGLVALGARRQFRLSLACPLRPSSR